MDEIFERLGIRPMGEEDTVGDVTIAPGAPDFLAVALDAFRQVIVDDAADVWLIDTHAKGNRRDDHSVFILQKRVLRERAHFRREAGVIGARGKAVLLEHRREALGIAARGGIDDGGSAECAEFFQQKRVFFLSAARIHAEAEIGAMEAAVKLAGAGDAEVLADFLRDGGRGGGGEGEDARHLELPGDAGDFQVVRAEIVPPLGNAMRFIDRQQADVHGAKVLAKTAGCQPLGGEKQ